MVCARACGNPGRRRSCDGRDRRLGSRAAPLRSRARTRAVWTEARPYLWLIFPAVGGWGSTGSYSCRAGTWRAMIAVLFLVGFALVRLEWGGARRFVGGVLAIIFVVGRAGTRSRSRGGFVPNRRSPRTRHAKRSLAARSRRRPSPSRRSAGCEVAFVGKSPALLLGSIGRSADRRQSFGMARWCPGFRRPTRSAPSSCGTGVASSRGRCVPAGRGRRRRDGCASGPGALAASRAIRTLRPHARRRSERGQRRPSAIG